MRMSRRSVLAGAGAAAVALAAGGCGGGTGAKAGEGSAPPGTLSGELSVLTPAFGGADKKKVYEAIVAEFNQTHPDVTVVTDHTTYGKLNEKLTVSIAGGTIPDVIMSGVGWVEPFGARGVYAEFGPSIVEGQEYAEKILAPCTYDNKLYALPIFLDTRCMIGNTALWDRAGIGQPPTSFAEFREAAKELTGGSGRNKQWGFMINSWGSARQTLAMALGANGGTMFDESGSTALLNSPEAIEAMEFLVGMIKDGSTSWDFNAAEGSPHPFLSGKVGISICPSAAWPSWSEGNAELLAEDGSTQFRLQNTAEAIFLGGTLVSRSAQSQNADAADAFVKHIAGAEPMQKICEVINAVPALQTVLQDSSELKDNRFVDYAVESLQYSASEGGSSAWMEIRGQLDPILEEAFVGKAEVEPTLNKANTMAQEAIDRFA